MEPSTAVNASEINAIRRAQLGGNCPSLFSALCQGNHLLDHIFAGCDLGLLKRAAPEDITNQKIENRLLLLSIIGCYVDCRREPMVLENGRGVSVNAVQAIVDRDYDAVFDPFPVPDLAHSVVEGNDAVTAALKPSHAAREVVGAHE